jgi:hypothetical protein
MPGKAQEMKDRVLQATKQHDVKFVSLWFTDVLAPNVFLPFFVSNMPFRKRIYKEPLSQQKALWNKVLRSAPCVRVGHKTGKMAALVQPAKEHLVLGRIVSPAEGASKGKAEVPRSACRAVHWWAGRRRYPAFFGRVSRASRTGGTLGSCRGVGKRLVDQFASLNSIPLT